MYALELMCTQRHILFLFVLLQTSEKHLPPPTNTHKTLSSEHKKEEVTTVFEESSDDEETKCHKVAIAIRVIVAAVYVVTLIYILNVAQTKYI